ncbi:MAG: hypothetical protein NC311_09900 [Muribaculaceae bacterium]|nr:hypothetical protein [Muribaculaceae bacterium]
MGYMIQIEERKADEMKEHAKKMLRHGGKLMECIEELCEESSMGERGNYGSRYGNRYGNRGGGYGNRMGYREEDYDDEESDFGQRRGVPGSGRGRYRY